MKLVKYTIKSWFITKREILSLRVFKNTYLALSSYFTNYGNLKHMEKKTQFLRKLKCFKKLTKIFLSLTVRLADTVSWQVLCLKIKAFVV